MEKQKRAAPFGLLFEEVAPPPQDIIVPTYDEDTDLSYVKDSQGRLVPYVEAGRVVSTATLTKVRVESTDTDPEDDDARFFGNLSTVSMTRIRAESTDTDPDDDNARFFGNLATESATFVQMESTDTDPEDDDARFFGNLAAQSATSVQAKSDTALEDDQISYPIERFLIGTDTFTEAGGEPTDSD